MLGYLIIVRDRDLFKMVENLNGIPLAYNPIVIIYSDELECSNIAQDAPFKDCYVVKNMQEFKDAIKQILGDHVYNKLMHLANILNEH